MTFGQVKTMTRKFTVTRLFSLEDEEIPEDFSFDVPVGGDFQFLQESNDIFLYCDGDTTAVTTKVLGKLVVEGDEIPPDYTMHAILASLIEDELTWITITIKEVQPLLQKKVLTWKKKF